MKKVVSGVPPEYTNAEIQEASRATTAVRIKKLVQGVKVKTSSIILTYKEESDIPEAIYFKFLKFKVRDYIPTSVIDLLKVCYAMHVLWQLYYLCATLCMCYFKQF